MKVANAAKSAFSQAQNIETQEEVDKIAEKMPYTDKLSQFSEKQLKKFEAVGEQVTGVEAGQSMAQLKGFAIGLLVVGVTVTVGLSIMSNVKSNINNSNAEQGATDAINGMTELTGFLPIIGLVVAAAVVITVVTRGFGNAQRGRA